MPRTHGQDIYIIHCMVVFCCLVRKVLTYYPWSKYSTYIEYSLCMFCIMKSKFPKLRVLYQVIIWCSHAWDLASHVGRCLIVLLGSCIGVAVDEFGGYISWLWSFAFKWTLAGCRRCKDATYDCARWHHALHNFWWFWKRRCCNMAAVIYGHAIAKGAKIEGNKIVHNGKCNERASKCHPTHLWQNQWCHGKGKEGGNRASSCYTNDRFER